MWTIYHYILPSKCKFFEICISVWSVKRLKLLFLGLLSFNSDQSTSGKEFAKILINDTSHTRALFYAEATLEQWKAVEN